MEGTDVKHLGEKQREDEDDEEDVSIYWKNYYEVLFWIFKYKTTEFEEFLLEWKIDQTDVSQLVFSFRKPQNLQ